jgi:hypothetical protein
MFKNTPLYVLIAIFIGCITQVQAQTCPGSLTVTLAGSTSGSATAAPTGTPSQTFCAGATVADLVATGTNIKWYAAASGGSALATTTVLTTATHYYATQTIVNSTTNCESVSRFDVTVTVTPKQTIALSSASGTNTQTVCATNAMTNVTYAITNQASVTMSPNLLGGPVSGLSATFSSGTLTISGTPTATVNYTVTVVGGTSCTDVTAIGSVTVTPKQTIALSSASGTNTQTVCATNAMTNITYAITNQTSVTMSPDLLAGAVSGLSATFSSGTLAISGTPTATVNYTVTVVGGTNCADVTATGSVTANPAIVAGSCTDATDACQLSTGQIRITVSGGTTPYTLTSNGKTVAPSPVPGTIAAVTAPTGTVSAGVTSYLFTGLAGNVEYKFRLADNKGCVVGALH